MKTVFSSLLVFVACQVFAQQPMVETPEIKINSIKISLLDMLEPNSNAFLLSYEFQLGQHFSLLNEGGLIVSKYEGKPARGRKIREELRWLFLKTERSRAYVGLQFMHKNLWADDVKGEFCSRFNQDFEYLKYDYNKKVNALNFSLGLLKTGYGRQIIDLGCFLGYRKLVTDAKGIADEWSLCSDDPALFTILLNQDVLPQSKTFWTVGLYFRYGFRVGPL